MPTSSDIAGVLRPLLTAITANSATPSQTAELVSLCHGMAIAVLRRKIRATLLQTRFHYDDYRDMAYDCIGELFQQDEPGRFKKLKAYFDGVNLATTDNEELLIHLRRLITSSVNQAVFRINAELDPTFARILRNIRLAVQAASAIVPVERFGEWYLAPAVADRLEHLPALELCDLERELASRACGNESVPELVSILSRFLAEQTQHARLVPLFALARAVRSMYGRDQQSEESVEMDDSFVVPDTVNTIKEVCRSVKAEFEPKYVGKLKLSDFEYADYFTAIEETLIQRFLGTDGSPESLFEQLKTVRPGLSRQEYYERHRSVMEYLSRLAHDQIVTRLEAEMK